MTKITETQKTLLSHLAKDGYSVNVIKVPFMGRFGGGYTTTDIRDADGDFVWFGNQRVVRATTVLALARLGLVQEVASEYRKTTYTITNAGRELV